MANEDRRYPPTMRLLVVEDQRDLANFVARALEHEGYSVDWAPDATTARQLVRAYEYALVVLDLVLPDEDGLAVLADVRRRDPILPVIVVSARVNVSDRVTALDLGADDYLTKPFALDELLARVRTRLRTGDQRRSSELVSGSIVVDLRSHAVTRAGREVRLTAREFDLLVHLMRHQGQVLSRQQLLQGVWGMDFDPGTKVVEVYIGQLRKKLTADGEPDPIETLRQVGYRLKPS